MPHPLQDAFDKVVDRLLSTDALFTEYLVRKLVQAGHTITDAQRAAIRQQLQSEVVNDEIQIEGIEGEPIVLTQADYDELPHIERRLKRELDTLYNDTVNDAAATALAEHRNNMPAMLAQHKRRRLRFERSLTSTWEEALHLLELLLMLATDMGDRVNEDLRSSAEATNDLVFEVTARLHARACQISYEILTLLKAGYADGAMARW